MATNRGKKFEAEFRESVEAIHMKVSRIPDKVYWTGHRIASEESEADFWAFKGKNEFKAILIECKATSTLRIDYRALQPHQKRALLDFESFHNQSKGYVAVNFYDSVSLRRFNECYMIPIDVWVEYEEKGDRKSLPIATCREDPRIIFCERIAGSIYNMAAWEKSL